MEKVLKYIKDQFYKIIMGFVGLVTTGFLWGIYESVKDMPKVKDRLTEQENINVDHNTRLYNAEKWIQRQQIIDSINTIKY